MPKQIIILETNPEDGGRNSIRAVYWFGVPLARRIVKPAATSGFAAISQAELDALKDGSVLEEVRSIELPASFTTAEIKAALQKDYADRLAYLGAQPNKLQYAGVFFDGAAWSA